LAATRLEPSYQEHFGKTTMKSKQTKSASVRSATTHQPLSIGCVTKAAHLLGQAGAKSSRLTLNLDQDLAKGVKAVETKLAKRLGCRPSLARDLVFNAALLQAFGYR
jgi:hypothetical protein